MTEDVTAHALYYEGIQKGFLNWINYILYCSYMLLNLCLGINRHVLKLYWGTWKMWLKSGHSNSCHFFLAAGWFMGRNPPAALSQSQKHSEVRRPHRMDNFLFLDFFQLFATNLTLPSRNHFECLKGLIQLKCHPKLAWWMIYLVSFFSPMYLPHVAKKVNLTHPKSQ